MKDVLQGFGLAINFVGVILVGIASYMDHGAIKSINDRDETRPSYPYVDSAIQRLEKRIDELDPAVRDTRPVLKVTPRRRPTGDLGEKE